MKGRTQLVLQEYFGIHKYFSISFRDEVVTVFLYKPCDREFCKIGGEKSEKTVRAFYFCKHSVFFWSVEIQATLDWTHKFDATKYESYEPLLRNESQFRSSHSEVFLGKVVLKECSKFTGEHPSQSAISIRLFCNFIEIKLRHECSPVTLLHIFRKPFPRNTSGWLLLSVLE